MDNDGFSNPSFENWTPKELKALHFVDIIALLCLINYKIETLYIYNFKTFFVYEIGNQQEITFIYIKSLIGYISFIHSLKYKIILILI